MRDELKDALVEFTQEREGSAADQTWRGVMKVTIEGLQEDVEKLEAGLQRVTAKQDQVILILVGAVAGNLVLTLLGVGR